MGILKENTRIKARYDNIEKSVNDNRLYRGLILNNDMKIMLISDSTSQKNAAVMIIKVGGLEDPKELPGLAHFCEHMLLTGSKKYPENIIFDDYLTKHEGYLNASTTLTRTTYYFDVASINFDEALDRFAQFFLEPLFNETLANLEVHAIDSEYEMRSKNDYTRLDQLIRSSLGPQHPYAKFIGGNKETLINKPKENGINVREKLINFYQEWYSSNLMMLTVHGNQSLDELEEMVVDKFSHVMNKNIQLPKLIDYPQGENVFMHKWQIVPVANKKELIMVFPIPVLSYSDYVNSSPVDYLYQLLNSKGIGSLSSNLKKQGWIQEISVETREPFLENITSLLFINISLTDKGFNNINDLILLIFQYFKMLQTSEPLEWFFDECKQIKQIKFNFEGKEKPINYALTVAENLRLHPLEKVIVKGDFFSKWNPSIINSVLDNLVPQKVCIYVTAKEFENVATETEQWFGTKYKKEQISEDIINKWSKPGVNSNLKLPVRNEFIPTSFVIKADARNSVVDKHPVIIKETSLLRVWFKQDDQFRLPKARLALKIASPFFNMDAVNVNFTRIYVEFCKNVLSQYTYDVNITGYQYDIQAELNGIEVVIFGFDQKIKILLDKIIEVIFNLSFDDDCFENVKQQYNNELIDFENYPTSAQAMHYHQVLMNNSMVSIAELPKSLSFITVTNLKEFGRNFLCKMHVECLITGNLTKNEALKIAESIQDKMTKDSNHEEQSRIIVPLSPQELMLDRALELEDGCNFLYQVENETNSQSSILVYYQTGKLSTESNMLLELLNQIIKQPVFDTLRTQEKLGYTAFSEVSRSACEQGLSIIVQSERHPKFLDERIEAFIISIESYLTNMQEDVFDNHKTSLSSEIFKNPDSLSSLSRKYQVEIFQQSYKFDRNIAEADYLKTITKQQILTFFKERILNKSTRRKLAVYVVSKKIISEVTDDQENHPSSMATIITNIDEFKTEQVLCPLPMYD